MSIPGPCRMQQDLAESEAEEYRQVLETFIALRAELESTLEMRDRQLSHATSSLMDNSGVIADLQQKLCMMEQRALAAESRAQSAEMTAANQSESMEHGRGCVPYLLENMLSESAGGSISCAKWVRIHE